MPKKLLPGLAAGLLLAATVNAHAFGGGAGAGGGGFGIPIWQPAPYGAAAGAPHPYPRHHAARRAYDRLSGGRAPHR